MQINQKASFENYNWIQNKGKRIVVLHNGQATNCSHCLKRAGASKVFELEGTTRAKMNNYMQSHRSEIGYVSMKI